MGKAVSAAAANRDFSKLLRGVSAGRSYVITSHGRPVANLIPVSYRVTAEKSGFKRFVADNIQVTATADRRIDIRARVQ